jgi:hypothetical protein
MKLEKPNTRKIWTAKTHTSWTRIKDNNLISCDHLLYKAKRDRAESELDTDQGQLSKTSYNLE